ncbi:MAG: hypothetical protein ACI4D8_07555 [Wujia sp.]
MIIYKEVMTMMRDDLVEQISMRRDIPVEDVEEVLEEQDIILEEEARAKKRRKVLCLSVMITVFALGAAAAMYILDKKQKIDMEQTIKKYADKLSKALER